MMETIEVSCHWAEVTSASQEVQNEIPAADADWESSGEEEPSSVETSKAGGEPSSADKETEVEPSSDEKDGSCTVGEIALFKLCGELYIEADDCACEERSSWCEEGEIHVGQNAKRPLWSTVVRLSGGEAVPQKEQDEERSCEDSKDEEVGTLIEG